MSHKYSTVHRLFRAERPVKKRVSCMILAEFRWWKYCHLRAELLCMFDSTRINDTEYLKMVGGAFYGRRVRGSVKSYPNYGYVMKRGDIEAALNRIAGSRM